MPISGTRRPARSRLAILEQEQAKRRPDPNQPRILAEEEWLVQFRRWAKDGLYDQETEPNLALAAFEKALAEASRDPEFFPPDDFRPELPDAQRRADWRDRRRSQFAEADRTFVVLLEMSERGLLRREEKGDGKGSLGG